MVSRRTAAQHDTPKGTAMLKFRNDSSKNIGKAECIDIVAIDPHPCVDGDGMFVVWVEGKMIISPAAGRPTAEPYFMMKVFFRSTSKYAMDKYPTGIHSKPYVGCPFEIIITNGHEFYAARHLTPEQLESLGRAEEANLWLLKDEELPERLTILTTADKNHIIKKIETFCEQISKQQDSPWLG